MADLPDRDKVVAELPEMAEFRPAIVEAWNRWLDRDPGEKKDLNDSARAHMVHCFLIASVAKRLGDRAEIHSKSALTVFAIRDYSVRFKKHDLHLVSRNQETDQVKAFMGQQPLIGIPTVWNLEVGYVLDSLGTEIVATNLVCPNGYKNSPYWSVALHNEGYELSDVHDLFGPDGSPSPQSGDEEDEPGARWKRRDSGVIIPFKPRSKSNDD